MKRFLLRVSLLNVITHTFRQRDLALPGVTVRVSHFRNIELHKIKEWAMSGIAGWHAGWEVVTAEDVDPLRLILVDHFPLICAGMRRLLEHAAGFEVVAEAHRSDDALRIAAERQPTVAVVDFRIAPDDGVSLAEQLREVSPETRVLLVSGRFESWTIERALRAGISGLFSKTEPAERLAQAVREVGRGEFWCSNSVREMIEPCDDGYRLRSGAGPVVSQLSSRERALLDNLLQGASLKQTARLIGVTYKVADHLKQSLMRKLAVHDRVELFRLAIDEGLLREPGCGWPAPALAARAG